MKRIAVFLLLALFVLFLRPNSFSTAPQATFASPWLYRTCNAFGYEVPEYTNVFARLKPPTQPSELVIWVFTEQQLDALQSAENKFESDNPDQQVTVVLLDYSSLRTQFLTALAAGEGPDILLGPSEWGLDFLEGGAIQFFEVANASSFTGVSTICWTCESLQFYGLPVTGNNVAFIRNPELVPDAPGSWDEVRQFSEDVVYNKGLAYGFVFPTDAYHFVGIQTAFGGSLFEGENVILDSEGSIASGVWLQSMIEAGLTPDTLLDYSSSLELFTSGQAAMTIQGPWGLSTLDESGIPYEVSRLPDGGRPFSSSLGFMVSAGSGDPGLATNFLNQYVATDEVMAALVDGTNDLSAYVPVLEAQLEIRPYLGGFVDAGTDGIPVPFKFVEVAGFWDRAISGIILGESSPEEAFSAAADEIRNMADSW